MNTPVRILLVEDEESVRYFLKRGLEKAGYAVEAVEDGAAAVELLGGAAYDVVLTDLVLPGAGGMDVLTAVHELDRESIVVLMTAHGTVQNAIEALRRGAYDYLTKPFELEELLVTVERGLERRAVERENRKLRFLVGKREGGGVATLRKEDGLAEARRNFEREYLRDLLRRTRGNVTRAASQAGISRPNFYKKLRSLDIDPADFKP